VAAPTVTWLHRWPETGPTAFRLGRAGDEVIAEWVGLGTLRADVGGTWSEFIALEQAHAAQAQARLRQHVAALLRHLRGEITLHASCVARVGLAVACVGESGAGKSTLAAQLCQDPAVALLADDTTALRLGGRVEVAPTEDHHWLRADIARAMGIDPGEYAKVPQRPPSAATGAVRLAAVVALQFDRDATGPALARIAGARAFAALSRSTFRFALDVPDVLRAELDAIARVAAEVPVFELTRPPDLAQLSASPRIVAELLHQLGREGV
jgi:hypothetical protein